MDEYLNVRETARALGVHENTIRNWVRDGTIRSARVPGMRAHRFEAAEVERLQRRRGETVAPVSPMLRVDGAELVGARDLDHWAATEDAKGGLPELVSRLLSATAGLTNIEMRAHEGVAASGWDGSATSAGTTVLPAGNLRFELGTSAKIKQKADEDYAKRSSAGTDQSALTFVFVTPRNWPGGQKWAEEKAAEGVFSSVRVLDAHTLVLWLHANPATHHWISERLGRHPYDVRTIATWWRQKIGALGLTVPPSFVLAGRSAATEKLRERLAEQGAHVTRVQGGARSEAIAFVEAATRSTELNPRVLVVETAQAWRRVVESDQPLILIPDFVEVDVDGAVARGHRVILPAGADERFREPDIALKKIEPVAAAEALREANSGRHDVHQLTAIARRSFAGFLRIASLDDRVREPEWLTHEVARVLAPLTLAGVWPRSANDQQIVSQIVGADPGDIEAVLQELEGRDDAPFRRSGERWLPTSPVESGELLLPRTTLSDRERWRKAIEEAFLRPDPFEQMDDAARLSAQVSGKGARCSADVKRSFAEQMALMGALSAEDMRECSRATVSELLAAAHSDETGETLARLAPVLPLLAEAAPEVFLDVLEDDLDGDQPVVRLLFRDTEPASVLSVSSPHTGLLWALEVLSWSPDYVGRVVTALVALTDLDPGGRLSNRPFETLTNLTFGWISHGAATVEQKISVIDDLLDMSNPIGWRLLLAVWPSDHQSASAPLQPRFRDWASGERSVTWAEVGEFVDGLVGLAQREVGRNPMRWPDLIGKLPDIQPRLRRDLIAELAEEPAEPWSDEIRLQIWKALTDQANEHERFTDAQWAMPAAEVEEWRRIASRWEPMADPRRHLGLFTWRYRAPKEHLGSGDADDALRDKRRSAVREVISSGAQALRAFAVEVDDARSFGVALAEATSEWDREVLSWFTADKPSLQQAASAFARRRVDEQGLSWVRKAVVWIDQSTSDYRPLAAAIPADPTYWSKLSDFPDDLESAYWDQLNTYGVPPESREEAVWILLGRRLAWKAIELLSSQLDDTVNPDPDVVMTVLRRAVGEPPPTVDGAMVAHHIETLLAYLESARADDPDLVALEFAYFRLVGPPRAANVLYRALNSNPAMFVDLVAATFRAEGESQQGKTADEIAKAHIAFDVLRAWPTIPGHESEVDGGDDLRGWVTIARRELSQRGLASVGDEIIGEVLAVSPTDADGIWPLKAVRDVVEDLRSTRVEVGLLIGVQNRRGTTWRGAFEGGDQERQIAERYRAMARDATPGWPRTGRLLRQLADAYLEEARWHDNRAERDGDHV